MSKSEHLEDLPARKRTTRFRLLACVFFAVIALCGGCIYDKSQAERGSIRDPEREINIAGREGLAFSRLLTAPVVMPMYFYKTYDYFGGGRPMIIFKTDPVSLTLSGLLLTAFTSPFIICEEAVVSLVEILTTAQFKSAYYPWETYVGNKRGRRYEEDINDPELQKAKDEANARLVKRAGDIAVAAIEVAGEVATEATTTAIERSITGDRVSDFSAGVDGSGDDAGGFGTIKGASSINEGSTAVYKLYVGGKLISEGVEWSGGTAITISNNGSYARVMAGNPPVKSGSYKSTLRASYKGRSFSKTISIVKTGKSALVNKYKK